MKTSQGLKGIIALALMFALLLTLAPTASANSDTFDLTVKHNINGRALGASKALPVDVCVGTNENDDTFLFDFEFKDTRSFSGLPAGDYYIAVYLDDGEEGNPCTGDPVMSLGPTPIPGDVDVSIKAKLGAEKQPTLKVKVR